MGPASPIRPITPPRRVLVTRSFRTRGEIEGFDSDWRLRMRFDSFVYLFFSRVSTVDRTIQIDREFFQLQLCDEN